MSEHAQDGLPERRHLRRLGLIFERQPIYYVTACTFRRQHVLTRPEIVQQVPVLLRRAGEATGWWVGRYVVMADHIHLFCAPSWEAQSLGAFMRRFRGAWTAATRQARGGGRLWQREFFDHVLRSDESYHAKWLYVRENPVRAKLVTTADEWPYQGDLSQGEAGPG